MKIKNLLIFLSILVCAFTSQTEILSKTDLDKNLEKRVVDTSSDIIVFEDGDKSIVKIVDTLGCKIKMIRKGIKGSIDKALIDYIVFNGSTIDYRDFSCNKIPKKAVNIKNTDVMRLYQKLTEIKYCPLNNELNKCDVINNRLRLNTRLCVLDNPLVGLFSENSRKYLDKKNIEYLSEKFTLNNMSALEILNILESDTKLFDYALIITYVKEVVGERDHHILPKNKLTEHLDTYKKNLEIINNKHKSVSFDVNKAFFEIQILLVDLKQKSIVFDFKKSENVKKFIKVDPEDNSWRDDVREKGFRNIIETFFEDFKQYCN